MIAIHIRFVVVHHHGVAYQCAVDVSLIKETCTFGIEFVQRKSFPIPNGFAVVSLGTDANKHQHYKNNGYG